MPYLKILVEGYARRLKNGWEGSSTCVFIKNEGKSIIVDPGIDTDKLLKALKNERISGGSIDYVFLTHYHIDHIRNITFFTNANIVDGFYVYEGTRGLEHDGMPLGKDIEILHTPGHTPEHSSLLVEVEGKKYAIAGDVIWWDAERKKELFHLPDPFAYDLHTLLKSRRKLMQKAEYIIPGHGKIVKDDSFRIS